MRVRILYQLRNHPGLKIGEVHELDPVTASEYLPHGFGEVVREAQVERAVAPPAPERAVEVETRAEPVPDWPLKTKTPEEYVEEWGETDPDRLSPTVAKNLDLARKILAD